MIGIILVSSKKENRELDMMSLSNTAGHAIRALACLAGCKNPPANIRDVAECADVPQAYLAKIVKKLNDSGIVESKRGNKGGIWLARPPKLISLLDISLALDGEDFLGRCLLGTEYCSDERACPTHKFWVKNKEMIRKELDRIKLSDVLDFNTARGTHQMPDS
jgi:Rrf2 family iron-sulfur cluster assembly transcriptional regulator